MLPTMLQLKMLFVLAYNLTIVKFLLSGGIDFWWWEEGEKLSEGKSIGEIILVGSGISKLSAGGGGGVVLLPHRPSRENPVGSCVFLASCINHIARCL